MCTDNILKQDIMAWVLMSGCIHVEFDFLYIYQA